MKIPGRRRLVAGLLLGAVLAAAVYTVHTRTLRTQAVAAGIAAQLEEARVIFREAAEKKLEPLAAESFARARGEVETAAVALASARLEAALPLASVGLEHAKAARDEALGRTPLPRAATLRAIVNTVLHRSAEDVAWKNAEEKMSLYAQDRISTKERSEAWVRFDENNELKVEQNSVMVVERMVQSRTTPTLSMALALTQGSLRQVVQRENDREVRIEINLPRAGIVIDTSHTKNGHAEVGARVHPDQSNRVAVYTGEAEVVSPSGDKVVLKQNQYAEVSADGKLSEAHELPTSAITILPGRNATVYTSSQRPEVTFKWKAAGTCAVYRIEVASDDEFLHRVIDEKVSRASFTYGNLIPGRYLWRISCLDDKGTAGAASPTSLFAVVVDNQAPRLAVLAPEANSVVSTKEIEARCRIDKDASVFINGEEATRAEGNEFVRQVALNLGVNTLVFEAVDAAGNVIYNSRLVTRKP